MIFGNQKTFMVPVSLHSQLFQFKFNADKNQNDLIMELPNLTMNQQQSVVPFMNISGLKFEFLYKQKIFLKLKWNQYFVRRRRDVQLVRQTHKKYIYLEEMNKIE